MALVLTVVSAILSALGILVTILLKVSTPFEKFCDKLYQAIVKAFKTPKRAFVFIASSIILVVSLPLAIWSCQSAKKTNFIESSLDYGIVFNCGKTSSSEANISYSLYRRDALNGEKICISETPDKYCPTFSPDGREIAYSCYEKGSSRIKIIDRAGEESRYLTSNADFKEWGPSWCPDGNHISFIIKDEIEDNYKVLVADLDDMSTEKIGESENRILYTTWSPDGNYLFYLEDQIDKNVLQIYNFATAQFIPGLVPLEEGFKFYYPSFSPDQTKLAMVVARTESDYGIYIYDCSLSEDSLDLGSYTILEESKDRTTYPTWSPDGDNIVYLAYEEDVKKLYIKNLKTNENALISERHCSSPSWSYDGERVVFSQRSEGNMELFTWIRSSNGVYRVTKEAVDYRIPRVSPDGKYVLALAQEYSKHEEEHMQSLVLINIEEDSEEKLFKSIDGWKYSPTWASSGKRIAFINSEGSTDTIFISDAPFKEAKEIHVGERISAIDWGRDDNELYISAYHNGYGIFKIDLETSPIKLKLVFTLEERCTFFDISYNCELIAFESCEDNIIDENDNQLTQIYIASIDGKNKKRVTIPNDSLDHKYPVWSPGQEAVIFSSNKIDSGKSPYLNIVKIYGFEVVDSIQLCEGEFADWTSGT